MTSDAVLADYRTDRRQRIWAIFGSSSGNLVEWFDFYAYAFTALYFATAFFPKGNQTTQLLQTAAVFAIGFLMRPIGGYVFGFVADKYGRKNSMMISVLMMCAGSLAIAMLPTYATIGAAAPCFCCWRAWYKGCRSAASTVPAPLT
jgi:MFS family permease